MAPTDGNADPRMNGDFDDNQFNVSRGLSYLRALGLHWGVAANFGKEVAEFVGLRLDV